MRLFPFNTFGIIVHWRYKYPKHCLWILHLPSIPSILLIFIKNTKFLPKIYSLKSDKNFRINERQFRKSRIYFILLMHQLQLPILLIYLNKLLENNILPNWSQKTIDSKKRISKKKRENLPNPQSRDKGWNPGELFKDLGLHSYSLRNFPKRFNDGF